MGLIPMESVILDGIMKCQRWTTARVKLLFEKSQPILLTHSLQYGRKLRPGFNVTGQHSSWAQEPGPPELDFESFLCNTALEPEVPRTKANLAELVELVHNDDVSTNVLLSQSCDVDATKQRRTIQYAAEERIDDSWDQSFQGQITALAIRPICMLKGERRQNSGAGIRAAAMPRGARTPRVCPESIGKTHAEIRSEILAIQATCRKIPHHITTLCTFGIVQSHHVGFLAAPACNVS